MGVIPSSLGWCYGQCLFLLKQALKPSMLVHSCQQRDTQEQHQGLAQAAAV